jgi:hypothetical protein
LIKNIPEKALLADSSTEERSCGCVWGKRSQEGARVVGMKLEIRIIQWKNTCEGRKVLGLMGAWRGEGWCPDKGSVH